MPFVVVSSNPEVLRFYKKDRMLPVIVRGRAAEIVSTEKGFRRNQPKWNISYEAGSWRNSLACNEGKLIAVKAHDEESALEEVRAYLASKS